MLSGVRESEPDTNEREPQVHPGHDFMFVLDGAVRLTLGDDITS